MSDLFYLLLFIYAFIAIFLGLFAVVVGCSAWLHYQDGHDLRESVRLALGELT